MGLVKFEVFIGDFLEVVKFKEEKNVLVIV